MYSVTHILLPVFGLILAGYICRRTGKLGSTGASELNRFVVWLCLPALLFKTTATASWAEIWHPGFVATFSLSTVAVFVTVAVWRLCKAQHLADASMDGLSAAYANTGYIGIPLCVLVLGDDGLVPALVATLIVVCVLFAIAVVLVEIGLQAERRVRDAVGKVIWALAKNPLVAAPVVGAMWAVSGLSLPQPGLKFLELLSDATIPCALVSLGAFLTQDHASNSRRTAVTLTVAKLIVQPAVTIVLAVYVFALPPLWAKAAILLSALPTGTGPFMLAEFYRREASVVAETILYSTLGSLVTLTLCLFWIH